MLTKKKLCYMNLLINKIKILKNVFNPLQFPVFIKDAEGCIIYMNPAFIEHAGRDFSEVIFEKPVDFLEVNAAQIRELEEDDLLILTGEQASITRILFIKNGTGESKVMRVVKTPLKHKKHIVGILCFAEDYSSIYKMHFLGIELMIMELSGKQRIVIFLYSRGMSRAEVARCLNIEPTTVDSHYQRAKEKLNLSDNDFKYFLSVYKSLISTIINN